MMHSGSKRQAHAHWALKALCLLMVWHLPIVFANARPQLLNLDIDVVLSKNGDAHITETRQMTIDSEGTECYIVIGNIEGSELRDFKVTDETGMEYENVGSWDVNQSRAMKRGRCGIVTKGNGYELCWGLGDSGERTYTVSYIVTNLLRAYSDADGFNYMFVAEGLSPSPSHVRVDIVPEDAADNDSLNATMLTEENTAIWAFRYHGEVNLRNGHIVAETSVPFNKESAMIVMARFDKGLFEPAVTNNGTFEQVKQRAFKDSDYVKKKSVKEVLYLIGYVLLVIVLPIALIAFYFIYVWRARKKVKKDLLWYRAIPHNGDLQWANNTLNALRYVGADYKNLLSASVLKLINLGAISIEKGYNHKGKLIQFFVIRQLPDADKQSLLMRKIHYIFQQAAGEDSVLEPWELKTWMKHRNNQAVADDFIKALHTKTSIRQLKSEEESVKQLYGLKKYLKDFSLLNERHVQEVWLWKDYMIYATLFGIADQVIDDMKKVNPAFFQMDQIADQMADKMTLPTIYSAFHSSTLRAEKNLAARTSGRGGSSSWGGGGGFSGGGHGGGVR